MPDQNTDKTKLLQNGEESPTLNQQESSGLNEREEMEMGQIFSTKNPKDFGAGLSSGLKSMGKGIVGGVASLIAMPIAGAREEGAIGFAKGLGLGIVSAAALTVGGVGTGLFQVGRGIVNTPNAISSKANEQIWDEEKRVWYSYNLPVELEEIGMLEQEQKQADKETKSVHSTEMYEMLGVESTATAAEIKKAYRVAAIKQHPDKNLSDPLASEKFQKLGEAYQILSNPQLRAAYDEKGKEGIDKSNLMDSSHLFEMIFGSARFESYVGELQLLSMTESMKATKSEEEQIAGMFGAQKQMKFKQKKREVNIAMKLAALLQEYIDDKSEDHFNFQIKMKGEAEELASTAFGGTLIGVLGYVYEEQAIRFLGFKKSVAAGLGITNVAESAHIFASKYKVLTSAVKMYKIAKEEEKKQKAKQALGVAEDAAQEGPDQKTIAGVMETLWNFTVIDVEATLRAACLKVVKDASVPYQTRVERAEGMLLIGLIFKEFGVAADKGLSELEKTMGGRAETVHE